MEWVPVVKPHKIEHARWSTRHPIDLLETLTAPYVDPDADCSDLKPGVQLLANGSDLVYVSSPTTLTVLHSVLSAAPLTACAQTQVAQEVVLAPHVSNIQVFETKLSVFGLTRGTAGCVYAHTLYHVFLLSKQETDQYSIQLLYTAEDQILDVREGAHSVVHVQGEAHVHGEVHVRAEVHVLTAAQLMCLVCEVSDVEVQLDIDMSDVWRITPVSRAQFTKYNDVFILVEPTAIHFVSPLQHTMVCSIPTEYLEYSERFLNFTTLSDRLIVITQRYVLVYLFVENGIALQRQVSHNVDQAHFCQFYPSLVHSAPPNLDFSIFSIEKISFFTLSSIPDSEYITFLVPYKAAKLRNIQTSVLGNSNYLKLSVDKRNCVTQRINSGVRGALSSGPADRQQTDSTHIHYILSEHNDLFCNAAEHDVVLFVKCWDRWLSDMTFDREYWVESIKVDLFYNNMWSTGNKLCKEEHVKGEEEVTRDPLLEGVTDKYTRSLIDKWDWS